MLKDITRWSESRRCSRDLNQLGYLDLGKPPGHNRVRRIDTAQPHCHHMDVELLRIFCSAHRAHRILVLYAKFIVVICCIVVDLIYWRNVPRSALFFSSTLVLLGSVVIFSVISVFSYLFLVVMTVTLSYRIYKNVMTAVRKTGEGHPFQLVQ